MILSFLQIDNCFCKLLIINLSFYLNYQSVEEKVLNLVCAFNGMCRKACSTNDMSLLYEFIIPYKS